MSQIPYHSLPSLQHTYFEDSYVLSIDDVNTSFDLEVVLLESHPLYIPPSTDSESYCYKNATLSFPNTSFALFLLTHNSPSIDPLDGSLDYGNIDSFFYSQEDNTYYLDGDWGSLQVISDTPSLSFH